MKKLLKDYDIESILDLLRTFSYTTEVSGETVTVNVELFTHAQNKMATLIFLQRFGDRVGDTVMKQYEDEEVSATDISDIIKVMCVQKWKHWLECWKAEYNPIWNVDGTEKRTITTQYGKITTMEKNSKLTDEQKTDGKNNITHGLKVTDEQKTDGKNDITHGLVDTITEPTTTGKVAAFDSVDFVNASQTSATQHSDTQSGNTNTAISMGTIEHSNSGSTNTAISMGKIEHASSGSDTDTLSGSDTVTDTLVRGGNIGVTMTQQLLTAENNFWSEFSFFEQWFSDIADEISLPIWG